jgi:hypothetical protein
MFTWIKIKFKEYKLKKINKIIDNSSITALYIYQFSTLNVYNLFKPEHKKKMLYKISTNSTWSEEKYNDILKKIIKKHNIDYNYYSKRINYELLKGEYTQWCLKNIFSRGKFKK